MSRMGSVDMCSRDTLKVECYLSLIQLIQFVNETLDTIIEHSLLISGQCSRHSVGIG